MIESMENIGSVTVACLSYSSDQDRRPGEFFVPSLLFFLLS